MKYNTNFFTYHFPRMKDISVYNKVKTAILGLSEKLGKMYEKPLLIYTIDREDSYELSNIYNTVVYEFTDGNYHIQYGMNAEKYDSLAMDMVYIDYDIKFLAGFDKELLTDFEDYDFIVYNSSTTPNFKQQESFERLSNLFESVEPVSVWYGLDILAYSDQDKYDFFMEEFNKLKEACINSSYTGRIWNIDEYIFSRIVEVNPNWKIKVIRNITDKVKKLPLRPGKDLPDTFNINDEIKENC